MSKARQTMRDAARVAGSPLLNYINRQFNRMESIWSDRMDRVEHRLLGDLEANAELTASHARALTELRERLDDLPNQIAGVDMTRAIGRTPSEIDLPTAQFANWLAGTEGFASQAHHWLNHGIAIEHRVGAVGVADINERTVEVPYVLQALNTLTVPSRIFDLGSLESMLPLWLASLGHQVTALDLHPYPFAHPRVDVVASAIQDWPDPTEQFDAVVSLSSLEHMGLSSYGQRSEASDLDRETMARFRKWLRPGGLLVFTAPFGGWHVDDFQRVYDTEHLDALLTGFLILDRRYAVQSDGPYWGCTNQEPVDGDRDAGSPGVVLVTATPET